MKMLNYFCKWIDIIYISSTEKTFLCNQFVCIQTLSYYRDNLTKRITDNVRAARAEVTPSVINDYENLAVSLVNIAVQNIYN